MGAIITTTAAFLVGAAASPTSDTLVFTPLAEKANAGQVEVFHGVDANEKEWLTVASTTLEAGACTATLVGLNTLLTAAHCVDRQDNTTRPARLDAGGKSWTVTCQIGPAYLAVGWQGAGGRRAPSDYALCLLTPINNAGPYGVGLRFETLNFKPLKKSDPVLLVGWGCSSLSSDGVTAKGGGGAGKLRLGDTTIARPASSYNASVDTLAVGVQPAACPGDSGGPLITGASAKAAMGPDLKRRVRGVISTVGPTEYQGKPAYLSTMAALSDPAFQAFATAWVKGKDVSICGLLPQWPESQGRCT
jgi:Trypsin